MEPESGNNKSNHHRRSSDGRKHVGGNRNLDWGSQATDIPLLPLGLDDLSGLLRQSGQVIPLLSDERRRSGPVIEPESAWAGSNITPIRPRQPVRETTTRTGLTTWLGEEDLYHRCRRTAIETALVKTRDERRLYLATGFVRWQSDSAVQPAETTTPSTAEQLHVFQAPLLFFPMRLIHEDLNDRSRGKYLLIVDSDFPDFNFELRDRLRDAHGLAIPHYTSSQSLQEYLDNIQQSLDAQGSIEFEPTLALGLANSPAGLTSSRHNINASLSPVPTHFQPELVRELLAEHSLEEFRTILKLLAAGQPLLTSQEVDEHILPQPGLTDVLAFSKSVQALGLDNISFSDLPDIAGCIRKWCKQVRSGLETALIQDVLKQPDISAIQLVRLAGIIELLDKAPENTEDLLHRDLAFRATPILMKRAHHQALLIEEELAQLQLHFHLDRLPAKSQLLQLIDELAGAHPNGIEVVDSHYFNARRQFMNFSLDKPASLSDEHRRLLTKLVKVIRFRELFVNNTEYRLALGPGYRGLRTDWKRLEKLTSFSQELSKVIGSEEIAATALGNWNAFRSSYINSMQTLQSASEGLQRLNPVVRIRDNKITAQKVLQRAEAVSVKLSDWQPDRHIVERYPNRNAQELIALFSGDSKIDSKAESLVREASLAIQAHIEDRPDQQSLESVNDTIQWLQQAINQQQLSLDDLNRIVDRYHPSP